MHPGGGRSTRPTHGLPPADPAREAQQIARLRQLAEAAKLDPDFAEKFLNFIVTEVIRHHEAIRQKERLTPPLRQVRFDAWRVLRPLKRERAAVSCA